MARVGESHGAPGVSLNGYRWPNQAVALPRHDCLASQAVALPRRASHGPRGCITRGARRKPEWLPLTQSVRRTREA